VCRIYNIPRSSLYYKRRKRISDTILKTRIAVHRIFEPYYGYRRHSYHFGMNKKKVHRIVQSYSLYWLTRMKRKFIKPGDRNIASMWVVNFKKDFEIQNIHHFWSSDFTHLYFKGVQFYLATILDEYSKQIVGYSLWFHHSKELIFQAIKNAVWKTKQTPLFLHSDQGSEYRSYEYFEILKKYNISASMSRKSSPWENGSQESFYWKLKFELWDLNRFKSMAEVIEAIHLHIYYYNNFRIHTTLKMAPAKFAKLHS